VGDTRKSMVDQNIEFPKNPFEDIFPSDFNKLNKKHVTEDFVEENFKSLGWDVFRPFNDTGIDRIITKIICPLGHTQINENLRDSACPICKSKGIEINRFIQIKTRQLKENLFGFTLKSKDIRIDPRHIYLLYSDNTSENKQDFFIVSIQDLLSFFDSIESNPFSPTSFRKGNNKLNSLRYQPQTDTWTWNSHNWDVFRNLNGLKKIQDPTIDKNLGEEISRTKILADKLLKTFSKGRSYTEDVEASINKVLKQNLKVKEKVNILSLRKEISKYLNKHCDRSTLESMSKYFEYIKKLDTIGEEKEDE